eukprot:CAMPEP_0178590906 /NCGR_PEP_ID=MMETSP0697-20121206/28495_1 /TAXON_ID=265572 /ORGANISM="Extubocellulus spinifer, Strain CCMP396" /LENGTH=790 /DNA_ID=CAMNT_0020227711 /DNA_START=70 /DNA_END=2440 /DNA_ORIENTATION=-
MRLNSRVSSVADDAAAYNAAISASVDITDAYLRNGILTLVRSGRDVDSNSRRSFLYQIPVDTAKTHQTLIIPPPTEIATKIKARIPSASGDKIAILVEEAVAKDGENVKADDTRKVFEIWTEGGHNLAARIVLPKDMHGKVCTDVAWFGGFSWSPDETTLVYVAEATPPKTASFFDEVDASATSSCKGGADDRSADTMHASVDSSPSVLVREKIGEKNIPERLATGNVGHIQNVPGDAIEDSSEGGYSFGQPVFSPDGNSVVYVGWDAGGGGSMPRRLGSIYCYQRPAKLYSSRVATLRESLSSSKNDGGSDDSARDDEGWTCLTPNDRLARSPRFSPALEAGRFKMVFLCNTPGFDTHGGCMELHSIDWDADKETALIDNRQVLVENVDLPTDDDRPSAKIGGICFPGLFVNQLPTDCFSEDGKSVYMTTQWGSISRAIEVSTENGRIKPLRFRSSSEDPARASQSIFSVTKDGAIVSESEPGQPATVGYISSDALNTGGGAEVQCLSLHKMESILGAVSGTSSSQSATNVSFEVLNVSPSHGEVAAPVQAILMFPDNPSNDKLPLIVVPHGGPHSCTATGYIPSYSYLCRHGKYAILHVNYRGSTGFGQAALESLAGTAGILDVKDVVHAVERVLESYSQIDPSRVGICGGSHGGYLAGHCIGQYPDLFKVAAMRNPVTNIATMVSATDIADWCYIETLGPGGYDWNSFRGPTREELGVMFDASPIAHVDNVKAPTLVALGMSDRRVPPSQGLEYYHTLRSKGVRTKLLVYEKDGHAIDRVASEADHW